MAMRIISNIVAGTLLLPAVILSGCAGSSPKDIGDTRSIEVKAPWVAEVQKEVGALGARNWIVVTESAFPAPEDPGVHVIVANAALPEVLSEVLESIESEGHIWPKIYTQREFEYLKEDYAPGVKKLRKQIDGVISERKSQQLTKASLETLLEVGMKHYRVVIIKTNSAYPYSSVFMELDSGYWNGVSEDALRRGMDD